MATRTGANTSQNWYSVEFSLDIMTKIWVVTPSDLSYEVKLDKATHKMGKSNIHIRDKTSNALTVVYNDKLWHAAGLDWKNEEELKSNKVFDLIQSLHCVNKRLGQQID